MKTPAAGFSVHARFTVAEGKKVQSPGQAGALWRVSLRNVQHVGNFMSMFGNSVILRMIRLVNGSVVDPVLCLTCQYLTLQNCFSMLSFLALFPQPRPWGTDTVRPPSLQSAVLRERRVLRPWCPSASTRRASRGSTSSRACLPTSPPCQSARSASSWRSPWWVRRMKAESSLSPLVIDCCWDRIKYRLLVLSVNEVVTVMLCYRPLNLNT